MKQLIKHLFTGTFFCLFCASMLLAQNNRSYQLAARLMQQQKYAEALPLLEELNNSQPEVYAYANRLIDCLIQLKKYDQGLKLAQKYVDNPNYEDKVMVKIAELYHFKGEKEKALNIWQKNLADHPQKHQLYITTARSMISRREYLEAVQVYKQARVVFQNTSLFFGDIANAYMQAGEYEMAIGEWLKLLEKNPNQISFIQRSLLRYNDPLLYDITIVELNDRLANISISDPNYQGFYQLQIWLLQENKLFRRALAAAKEYESRSKSYNYSVYNLGRQLIENNEFELAKEAFTFYTDKTNGEVKWRSLEQLSNTYAKWAKHIDDYSLDFTHRQDSLYELATAMLDSIEHETRYYSGMKNVQLKRAELSLDHIFDLPKAKAALTKLKTLPNAKNSPEIPYLEGRLHLAKREYAEARIQFTRANKQANIGALAEKTRYFLALTDFYSGDYEFAEIQLKSLGRQNTSYYANDALELRLWLQQGLSIDTTGANLSAFADAVFKENNGKSAESARLFLGMIQDPNFQALKDDAMLFYVQSPHIESTAKLTELTNYLATQIASPIKEKLLWEQAKLAEQTHLHSIKTKGGCTAGKDCISAADSSAAPDEISISARAIYEQLILEYPQGFYAPYARERLTKLTNQNS